MKKVTLVFFSLLFFFLLQYCKSPNQQIVPDSGFGKYISKYTSGTISAEGRISVSLSSEVESEIIPGKEVPGLFSFNPEVKGKAMWVDKKTIEFVPESALKGGTVYQGHFQLGKVVQVEKGLEEFTFSFSTIKQSFSVKPEGLKIYSGNDFTRMYYSGYILTADVAESDKVEELLSATFDGDDKEISWIHDATQRKHEFRIDSLRRNENEQRKLILEWDGNPMGINTKGEEEVKIPALTDFNVLEAKIQHEPKFSIVAVFSDPLNKTQNFDGLITLGEVNLHFSVNGNRLNIYPDEPVSGQQKITIHQGIENALDYPLKNSQDFYLLFDHLKPQVKLIGKGVIVPQGGQLSMPFEAVSLKAVDIRIIEVYAENAHQFLQENQPDGNSELRRVGRLVYSGKVDLNPDFPEQYYKWNTYKVNLADYIEIQQGAFYRVEFRFRKEYSLFGCNNEPDGETPQITELEEELALKQDQEKWDEPGWYSDYYYPPGYRWQERDDPCSVSYYNSSNFVSRNIFASTLGIIAKEGKGHSLTFAVTNLNTTAPESGVTLSVYDYQNRLLQNLVTGNDGMASVNLEKKPFLLVAEKDGQSGYLRLDDGSSLSLSNFNVSGQVVQEGLKGFIYGERGVWRPGDQMFLTFILEDKLKKLPEDFPVVFKLINPLGQVVERSVLTRGENGFYHFAVKTSDDAPTGNWEVSIQVGGSYFTKRIKVETVKPNRLKIDFKVPDVIDAQSSKKILLEAAWLHGAPARSLNVVIDLNLVKKNTSFKGFEKYSFNDPASDFYPQQQEFFKGKLDEQGKTEVPVNFEQIKSASGMLRAYFTTRVYEQGGDFSINVTSADVSPFRKYLGIKMPDSEDNWYKTDTEYLPEIVAVDFQGNQSSVENVEVELYKIGWRWWWESSSDRLAYYVNGRYEKPVKSWNLEKVNGKVKINMKVKYRNWQDNGRYLLRVKNTETGQAAGVVFYMSKWGSWRSEGMAEGATMLTIRSDKDKYKVGDIMKISIPSSKKGRALVSIEGGDVVKDIFWVETTENATSFEVEVTPEMAPNVFVFVHLIQPYGQTENDAPLRLYGVIPVSVENPKTILNPVIKMKDEIEPEQSYEVEVSEENRREMTYTLAIVDEGLLGLTNFKTPDPHSGFYAREALGVLTWDMFDYVAGAYGARLEKAFAVGGDQSLSNEAKKKINRFKPVVEFAGPFTLKKGEKKKHKFTMPNYVGAVRAMVVAGDNGAYGKVDKEVKVRKGLMLLATLPRVLGPGETLTLPVDVFAMKENVEDVVVEVESNDIFEIENSEKKIVFSELGDQMVYFNLKVKEEVGVGKIKVIAHSGHEEASQEIEIEIRNPNPPETVEESKMLEAGENWNISLAAPGMEGTNEMWLEMSGVPSLNISKYLDYLIQYPYGCIEQVTSSVFPQLYLNELTDLSSDDKAEIEDNIRQALQRLMAFQLPEGGFSYWPGGNVASDWGTSYAGHFMILAEQKGYTLPVGMKSKWLRYQQTVARNWNSQGNNRNGVFYWGHELGQAYRLYTLALAGSPELGAMNRLRESVSKNVSRWRLAAAYLLAGQANAANELIQGQNTNVKKYSEFSGTFGSALRDKAMILETLVLQNERAKALMVLKEISEELNQRNWLSTQTAAWCFYAASRFLEGMDKKPEMNVKAEINGNTENFKTKIPFIRFPVDLKNNKAEVRVENQGGQAIFARLVATGIPVKGSSEASESDLKMEVWFTDKSGSRIDPAQLYQGDDIFMKVKVRHPGIRGGYEEMALTTIIPSGWEILNQRLNDVPEVENQGSFEYQNIRDDRIYTFFDLPQNSVKTFTFQLSASYEGKFYLPAVRCEAMYDNSVYANLPGKWVVVEKR